MPEFTHPSDGGKFIVEYEKVHYNLLSEPVKGKPNLSMMVSYDIAKDGSDRLAYDDQAKALCASITAEFPGRVWKLMRVFQNSKEEYRPQYPSSEETLNS